MKCILSMSNKVNSYNKDVLIGNYLEKSLHQLAMALTFEDFIWHIPYTFLLAYCIHIMFSILRTHYVFHFTILRIPFYHFTYTLCKMEYTLCGKMEYTLCIPFYHIMYSIFIHIMYSIFPFW